MCSIPSLKHEDIANMNDSYLNGLSVSDEMFDDFLKHLDFPLEDVEANAVEEDWDVQFERLGEPCYDAFSLAPLGHSGKTQNEKPQLGKGFSASCTGIPPIKPEKTGGRTYGKTIPKQSVAFHGKDLHRLRTYSPVSVFESSSSSSVENSNFDLPVIPAKRARSKRHRRSSSSSLFSVPFILHSPALRKYQGTPASESDLETCGDEKLLNRAKKQRKKDLPVLSGDAEMKRFSSQGSGVSRKCMHCEVTKTPQWREGPMGPKTLCNACGVRYRSGRLFPEYRPAASPTFVPAVHSNSHKKVLEMRGSAI